jgi:hypothetical protein
MASTSRVFFWVMMWGEFWKQHCLIASDADSSVTEDLPIYEEITIEGSEKEGRQ